MVEDVSSEPFVQWDYTFDVEKCSGLGKKIRKYENYWRTSVYNVIIDTTLQKKNPNRPNNFGLLSDTTI